MEAHLNRSTGLMKESQLIISKMQIKAVGTATIKTKQKITSAQEGEKRESPRVLSENVNHAAAVENSATVQKQNKR